MKTLTTEQFIEKARSVHGDKYDYSKVNYINSHAKVVIICPIHGEFEQSPNSHLKGSGCPRCCTNNHKCTKEEFIEKARSIHGDKYDYSKVDYVNNETKVCIVCHEHGEFFMKPTNHLIGQGCKKCYHEHKDLKYNTKSIIKKFRQVHGDKYDYSKVNYKGITTKVTIGCPIHGDFEQIPSSHLSGSGCPQCGVDKSATMKRYNNEKFIEKARSIHGDKYDYSKVDYVNNETKVCIVCAEHGEFMQTPDSHLHGCGCPSCSIRHSKYEEEIVQFIKEKTNFTVISNDRNIIKPLELDIYIPEIKLGIEFNGIRWHTEEFGKYKFYHLSKLNKCNESGIKLIQIFEDEMIQKHDIVFSKISHIIGIDKEKNKIYGRKCQIREVSIDEAKTFLDKFHIQGFVSSTVYLGAFYNDELIGVMNFKKISDEWELTRFASDYNYICCGVGGKLLNYFVNNYNPLIIKSFADRRWTLDINNNIYTKLGFVIDKKLMPDYRYVKNNVMQRIHKFNCRKQILSKKYNLPLTMTEKEMANTIGMYRIWDCGLIKYIWRK